MRSIAVAAIWFGLAFGVTQAVSAGLETWKVGDRDPYAAWVPPDEKALQPGARVGAKPARSIATSPAPQGGGIEG